MTDKQIKIGDVVAWDKVPSDALVWSDGYAARYGDIGCWVALGTRSEGRMWESWKEMEGLGEVWGWSSESGADATIVALDVPADATAEHLRELAEVFEVREALWSLVEQGGLTWWELAGASPGQPVVSWWDNDELVRRLHRAGWRPSMTAEDAARLLAEAG